MTRPLSIVFNQNEYIQSLGTGHSTIAQVGCYLCSFATLAFACGKKTTPPALNTLLVEKGGFVSGNLMLDDALTKVFPDISYQQSYHYESVPADLQNLKNLMSDPTIWVVLEIDLGSGNTHFVLCAGVNGVISIADSEGGNIIDFASKYGDPSRNILKFVVYKGNPASIDDGAIMQLQSQLDSANKLVSTLQEQVKTTGDQTGQQVQSLTEQNTILQNKLNDLTKQNNELANDITEFKTDLANLTDQNASLADLYQKESAKNSLAIKQGLKAPSKLQDFQDYINAIASYLKLPTTQKDEKQIVEDILDEVVKLNKIKQDQAKQQAIAQSQNTVTVSPGFSVQSPQKKVGFWAWVKSQVLTS